MIEIVERYHLYSILNASAFLIYGNLLKYLALFGLFVHWPAFIIRKTISKMNQRLDERM